jgi:hypothetical protein
MIDLSKLGRDIDRIYETHAAGCCLHIVLDDGNNDDASVAFCQKWARDRGHVLCISVADRFAQLTEEQRARVCCGDDE